MKVVYTDRFYEHLCFWKQHNQKIVDKIEKLVIAIQSVNLNRYVLPYQNVGPDE